MPEDPVRLTLGPRTADRLHAALEDVLESGEADPLLQEAFRALTWRILAAKRETGAGLTAELARLAREARSVEEFEASRDDLLGPLLGGLEGPENRDP